ncbi:MAG: HD domain-containing protein [Firmicutes bacterium]|nr:HD domain-containing protein [Bacillota bacterium]
MNNNLSIDFHKLLFALSTALDISGRGVMKHHIRVALIARQIAEEHKLDQEDINIITYASLLHDIGTITFAEKNKLLDFEVKDTYDHCERGARFLKCSRLLEYLSEIVYCHHDRWDGKNRTGLAGSEIPLASRIIHLADRVDVLIDNNQYILHQRDDIIKKIKSLSGTVLDPTLVDILGHLSSQESFWLDLTAGAYDTILLNRLKHSRENVNMKDLLSVGEVFAQVIDSKSSFTHIHSRLVSMVSSRIASIAGMTPSQCQSMGVAGLLHDLGKLVVPEEILEKPGRLTTNEYNIIKSHSYYTYRVLEMVEGFEEINQWASYHHETLNGNGYPFGIKGENINNGARIMAVSDIFAALVEDRPYRPGLPRNKVEQILVDKVKQQCLDQQWVGLLLENYNLLLGVKEELNKNYNPPSPSC